MTNDQIEKFLQDKNPDNAPVRIGFKTRKPFIGIFIKTPDYAELKSKNFWAIVWESNIETYQKSKDAKLSRIFNGSEITKLSPFKKGSEE
ncbi:short-chain dehydrogenase [Paraflavitalea speifideaquila]|jgi:hypothetical protein|uniref:short-chain dehydrogenase n=1 Tax=Paraflavitalea speifideaquila TaxID=3076558 RepID=UPI0028EAB087|nr:short-chain dehydrogenase [Paraflavitalea speifideiaquila]